MADKKLVMLPPLGDGHEILVQGNTVQEVLKEICMIHLEKIYQLFEADLSLRKYLNVYVNNEDIRFLQGQDTPLNENDKIYIVPAVAGG